jgi:hypothetical protein
MYDIKPYIVIGFHGCDLEVRNKLVNNPDSIEISKKPYDWLGHGIYFWENNYTRALEWAQEKKDRGKIDKPAVLGAVLQLGYCCDFLDSKFIKLIRRHHGTMAENYKIAGVPLPENIDKPDDTHHDKLIRKLDCAVIEFMHQNILEQYNKNMEEDRYSDTKVFDSTKGVFTEGGPAFVGSGLLEKSHIQICIRNMNRIKGLFIPREEIAFP